MVASLSAIPSCTLSLLSRSSLSASVLALTLALVALPATAQVATYTTYGSGCSSSALVKGGLVVPKILTTRFGNSATSLPFGSSNVHYMQVHDSADLPATAIVRGINLRTRQTQRITAYSVTLTIKCGYKSGAPNSLDTTFARNFARPASTHFQGKYNVKSAAGTLDPTLWPVKIPFRTPFIYTRAHGHFLLEVINTTVSAPSWTVFDAARGGALSISAAQLWANTATATTGQQRSNYAVSMQLEGPRLAARVSLGNAGVPRINSSSCRVLIGGALPGSAAALWLGAKKLNIKLSPTLPGCTLYTSLDVLLGGVVIDATGNGGLTLALPGNRNLLGVRFYNQWMVIDKQANGLGVVLSNGGDARIGF